MREYKRLAVRPDTWQEVNRMKYELGLNSVDDTIQLALGVLKIVKEVADREKMDVLETAKEMAVQFTSPLKRRWGVL